MTTDLIPVARKRVWADEYITTYLLDGRQLVGHDQDIVTVDDKCYLPRKIADDVRAKADQAAATEERLADAARRMDSHLCPECGTVCYGDCQAN